jgi:hypothetical protein
MERSLYSGKLRIPKQQQRQQKRKHTQEHKIMPEGKDKLQELHANLLKDNYDLPDFNTFKKDMSDPAKLEELRSTLISDNYDLPDSATFASDMGLKKKVSSPASSQDFPPVTPVDLTSGTGETVPTNTLRQPTKFNVTPQTAGTGQTVSSAPRLITPTQQQETPQVEGQGQIATPKPEIKVTQPTIGGAKEKGEALLQGLDRFNYSLFNTPSFVMNVLSYATNPLGDLAPMYEPNKLAEYYYNSMQSRQKDFDAKYTKGVTEYLSSDKEGDRAKGVSLLANEILKSAPLSIGLMMGNYAGLSSVASIGATGALTGAGKMMELQKQNPNMTPEQITSSSIMNGLFEGVFEQWGITKLGGISKDIIGKYGKDKGVEIVKKAFNDTYAPVVRKYMGIMGEEALGEAATQFAQNAVTKYAGENPDIKLNSGLLDAFLIGAVASQAFVATPATAEVIMTSKNRAKAKELVAQKQTLEADLEKATPDVKEVIAEEIIKTDEAFSKIAQEDKATFDALPAETQQEVGELIDKRTALEGSINEVSEVSKVIVEKKIESINEQIEDLTKDTKPELVSEVIPVQEKEVFTKPEQAEEVNKEEVAQSEQAEKVPIEPTPESTPKGVDEGAGKLEKAKKEYSDAWNKLFDKETGRHKTTLSESEIEALKKERDEASKKINELTKIEQPDEIKQEKITVYRGQQKGQLGQWFSSSKEFAEKWAGTVRGNKKSDGEVVEHTISGKVMDFPYVVTDYAKISDKLGEMFGVTQKEIREAIATTDKALSESESMRIHALLENKGFQDLLASNGVDYIKAKEQIRPNENVDVFIKINSKDIKQQSKPKENEKQTKATAETKPETKTKKEGEEEEVTNKKELISKLQSKGINKIQSFVDATLFDIYAKREAKRTGKTTEEIYSRNKFSDKPSGKALKQYIGESQYIRDDIKNNLEIAKLSEQKGIEWLPDGSEIRLMVSGDTKLMIVV